MTSQMAGLGRKLRILVGLLLSSVVLSGCDFDVYSLPLPGGTDVGDDPITVTVQFEDVLDLVPKSTVKVNDVSVGMVKEIELEGYHANVTLQLRNNTKLPENTVAEIRQTSLLGEKFVSLAAPETGAEGTLGDGDVIPLERSGRNPEVEEVLGALSLILNGGGVAQLKTIAQELNKAVTGREDNVRSVLEPDRHVHRHPRHQQGADRRCDRGPQPARALRAPAGGQHRRGARGAAERADEHRRPA